MHLLLVISPLHAATVQVTPGDDWCGAIRAAAPGDTVTLAPGDYAGPCTIDHGGTEGAPVVVAAQDPAAPPHIVYTGASSNVIDVLVSDVTLRGLAFGPTQADIDAVKIKAGSRVTVEDCTFSEVGGISVSANSADGDANAVLGCAFLDLQATGLYFGCHDGTCVQSQVRIEDNVFDGVTSSAVGYALEIKLDSWGTVARNAIRNTKGPGIEIYGSRDGSVTSMVEQNLVYGGESGAIEIGGGPAIVRNNIVIGAGGGGIVSYDYGGRGLVSGVHIVGNTAIGEGGPAFSTSGWQAGADLELRDNAGLQRDGGAALPDAIEGIPMDGNVTCGAACFVDAEALDLWPAPEGELVDAAVPTEASLETDFCGRPRGDAPDVGAFEASAGADPGALAFGAWADRACGADDSGGDDSGDTGVTPVAAGCGCAASAPTAPYGAFTSLPALAALGFLRRRRSATSTSTSGNVG
ncbi:MAG: right-handed parallel beta-helix repeat-containing protein [Pseudomonadota bacterium]|nr:right-handed parallel beta-helix repeat-containing protein [Pseudomonadota bacterium]